MFGNIVYKLPEGIGLSEHLRDKAIAYYYTQLFGRGYYIPITKEIKKTFNITTCRGKLIIHNETMFDLIVRDIINSIYLQIRDVVCAEIEQSLDQELKQGFSKLFESYLHKRVKDEVDKKVILLEDTITREE